MKKLSALILALVMLTAVLASCDFDFFGNDAEATPLEAAVDYIEALYKSGDGKETKKDYELVTNVNIEGAAFTVEWACDNEAVKLVPSEDGKTVTVDVEEQSAEKVDYTLTATIKDSDGNTATCTFTRFVPKYEEPSQPVIEDDALSVEEVLAKGDNADVVVRGTVIFIKTAWSEQYGNISVFIRDEAGDCLYIHRLKTNVVVGDVILVEGKVTTYNGDKQIAQGAVAVIEGKSATPIVHTEMTVAEALASEVNTLVKVTGTVKSVDGAWSDSYGNMNVTITDGNGNDLYVYRLATKVEEGDTVTISGIMGTYDGAMQIAEGATAVIG